MQGFHGACPSGLPQAKNNIGENAGCHEGRRSVG
jgi:hypothetical protein